jgi:putative hydrolase of the HAD superfamily
MNIHGIIFDFYNVLYVYKDGEYHINKPLLEFIDRLREKYKLGIISNISSTRLPYQDELEDHFDAIITSGATGYWKPDSKIYLIACENLGVDACETVIVDDSEGHLAGAKKIGMKPILYQSLEQLKTDLEIISKA